MKVRRALPADAAALAALECRQPRTAGWGEKGFATELAQPCAYIWCAQEQGEILGFLALRCAAGCAEILNVAVAPHRTRQGIGRALLRHLEEALHRDGIETLFLEVRASNEPARRLYEASGYRVAGVRKIYYVNPTEDALIMKKELKEC